MDLDEPIEPSRERAASSEPASSVRPKPFEDDDDNQSSSRKRQRMETDDPENISAAEAAHAELVAIAAAATMSSSGNEAILPATPTRIANPPATPNSNRVTLNLRNTRDPEPNPSSPHSPATPSKAPANNNPTTMEETTEPEVEANNVHPTIETPSSSLSSGEPEIMLVESEGEYFSDTAVAIIDDDMTSENDSGDPTYSFPFMEESEASLQEAAMRLAAYFETGTMSSSSNFNKLRIWMDQYSRWARQHIGEAFSSYRENREFWDSMFEVMKGLIFRKPHFGNWLKHDTPSRDALSCLFVAFARLTGQFVVMDLRTLRCNEPPNLPPLIASRPFLNAIWLLLTRLDAEHVGTYLVQHYSWDWEEEITNMHGALEAQGASLRIFVNLGEAYLDVVPRFPKLAANLQEVCRYIYLRLSAGTYPTPFSTADFSRRIELAYGFFEKMEKHLDAFIEKNATILDAECVLAEILTLADILEMVLQLKNGPGESRLQELQETDTSMNAKLWPRAVAARWKFSKLTKLITSSQMQLRVSGTACFCTELVAAFNTKTSFRPDENPYLRNIAEYVISINLVDYIVGVGSHPEIIGLSRDMVGFLGVTRTYTNYHTDKIWSTVKSSLDPRVVDSVLKLLQGVIPLLDPLDRMYFCSKLQETPIESFTVSMRQFCEALFDMLCRDAQGSDLGAPPYEVCVRLICESTVPRADAPFNEVQQWASKQFEELTNRKKVQGPDTSVRLRIYDRCVDDLGSGKTADGSLIALSLLVEANSTDLRQLIARSDFILLLIDNFSWRKTRNSITRHLSLFKHIILMNSIKDSTNLGLRLWNKIVGAEEPDLEGEACREGWRMLSGVMKMAKPENTFIKACIRQYLPDLPQHLFSNASFSFAREAIEWLGTGEILQSPDGAPTMDQNGVEQLWRMVLTSQNNPMFQSCAIHDLISFYLDSPTINKMTGDKILEIHLAFVDRCLQQITSAAGKLKSFSEGTSSGDDEPMIIVVPDKEVYEQESLFCRSLLLLKGFLRDYESNPRFALKTAQPPSIDPPSELKGEEMHVSYQIFDGTSSSIVQNFPIGKLNTGASLFGSLQEKAGFKNFRVYHGGRELVASDIDLSKSLDELRLGSGLMLVSRATNPGSWNERSPVQLAIMNHVDPMFDLLSMDGTQAKDIFDFLVWFPPYNKVLDVLASEEISCQELFPAQHPYKSLYAMHCLHNFMGDHMRLAQTDMSLKHRFFNLLVDTLTSHQYLESHTDEDFKLQFFIKLLEALSHCFQDLALRERLASDVSSEVLLDRLMVLLADAQESSSNLSITLMYKVFWTVLALSSASSSFWTKFKAHPDTQRVVQTLLLGQVGPGQKECSLHPASSISHVCSQMISISQVDQTEYLQFFWPLLAGLVPKATLHPDRCDPFLNLVQNVLRAAVDVSRARDISIDGLDLGVLTKEWGQLLNSHKVVQYVGRPMVVDPVAFGLASLVKTGIFYMESFALQPLRPLAFALFNTHLFPDVESDDSTDARSSLPLLDTTTRNIIVDAVLALVKGDEQSGMTLMKMTTGLVADPLEDGEYLLPLGHTYDRSREVRSATGYVGLKNLSNTCYLNSLMTQLFMNLSFREFMINAHVADGGAQKLLQQTQNLFCEMQNSFRRYADPHELALSIKTYDELPVDVTIQMDVDEFYNLLFDRWEGQILAADAKAAFRSFYGGQLVQQVKSKECAHISERLEPFSAIQCDIKGKASLKESLQAYVDGEIMEGDNKYKCSTCDQHVDAVKRACLKDVPDNLIFHLKRFDYNLREGRRNKLNDYFSFPNDIDMRPYKVDYLTNGPEGSEEDIFELVGVLVHSGTAESGHYYSYIRERPSQDGKSWVEFNDDQVTPFDPSNIEASCFGGCNFQASEYQFDKSYSAYMLFYQRRSFLMEQNQQLGPQLGVEPIKLPIHPTEARSIDEQNSLLMRMYALYDPSHAYFVKQLLSAVCRSGHSCSPEHVLEDQALKMTFNHMDQVFGRTKDTPEFYHFVSVLTSMFVDCTTCSERFTAWISATPTACRHFLLKSPDAVVRIGIADLIITALRALKKDAPHIYGFPQDPQRLITSNRRRSSDELDHALHRLNLAHGAFGLILEAVCQLWDNMLPVIRAWPEYFDLIARMNDGVHESALLMDNGIFKKTMDIIMSISNQEPTPEIQRLQNVVSRRSVNKPVPYEVVVSLMDKFLRAFDSISLQGTTDTESFRSDQCSRNLPLTLWPQESNCLILFWTATRDNIFVADLLRMNVNDVATQSILSQLLLKLEDRDQSMNNHLFYAITCHLGKVHSSYPPRPYLRGALTYCRYISDRGHFHTMLQRIKQAVANPDVYGGWYYLEFFKSLIALPDNRVGYSERDLWRQCTTDIAEWGPSLLMNYEPSVRTAAEEYISQTLLQVYPADVAPPEEDEDVDQIKTKCETSRALGLSCLDHLDTRFIHRNVPVLKNSLSSIKAVIEHCKPFYEQDSHDSIKFYDLYQHVATGMSRLAVNHLDEEGSVGRYSDEDDYYSDDFSSPERK